MQQRVLPGAIIHSDQWKVYQRIQERLQREHATVNHSVNFVDLDTGVHTQTIESCWARTKQKFNTTKGVNADALESYLDERMWRDRWGQTTEAAFNNICAHIAEQYPVWRSQVNSYTQTSLFRATKIFRKESKLLCIIINSF